METVCVKFGDLYSSEYVNQLYKQVGDPFYCMTEDREGIDSNIQILEANDELPERKWWNKTKLFKPGLMEGPFVYFDLDCYWEGSSDQFGFLNINTECYWHVQYVELGYWGCPEQSWDATTCQEWKNGWDATFGGLFPNMTTTRLFDELIELDDEDCEAILEVGDDF